MAAHDHEGKAHGGLVDAGVRRGEALHRGDPLAVVLEERLVRRHADVVAAFGRAGAEPRALPTREQQGARLALRDVGQPVRPVAGGRLRRQARQLRHVLEGRQVARLARLRERRLEGRLELRVVERLQLGEEVLLLLRRRRRREQLRLVVIRKRRGDRRARHVIFVRRTDESWHAQNGKPERFEANEG
eukprot:scaffold110805_cov47-Phaeocystis_antarctica.AAC.2